jgi:hypothetical protein
VSHTALEAEWRRSATTSQRGAAFCGLLWSNPELVCEVVEVFPDHVERALRLGFTQPDNKEVLLTTSRYEGGKLVEVRLYPVDCGIDGTRPVSKAGLPMTPSPEQAIGFSSTSRICPVHSARRSPSRTMWA